MTPPDNWLASLAADHTPDFAECLAILGPLLPLLYELQHTEQDPIWHGEGDVAIHTDCVLTELYQLLSSTARHITGTQRQILILSALLHDIAKPLTTRRKNIAGKERITASKHEEMGASYLATRLIRLPLTPPVIMGIMGLVGFHQIPKLLIVKDLNYSDYFQLALNADLELLYWLELADMKGRICPDKAQQLDLLEQYRLFAEEYGLWGIAQPQNNHLQRIQVKSSRTEQCLLNGYAIKQLAQGDIHTAEEAIAKNYQACQHYSHLYIMCGISGSGKSSWITNNLPGFDIISLDDIREELNGKRECQKSRGQMLQLAKTRLKDALAKKRNVVWDATNIRKDFRNVLCSLGENYGALITFVAFQLPHSSLLANNRNRASSVPDEIIHQQISKLEWPWFTEAHRMLIIGDKGEELYRRGDFE